MPTLPPLDRRRFLQFLAAGSSGLLLPATVRAEEKVRTNARIVIAGAGAAGLAAANRLVARLDGAKITVIDAKTEHWYQPGFTLVAAGIKAPSYVVPGKTSDFLPKGVEWIQARVAEFDPDGNKVVTDKGQTVPYDYLIVATGLVLDYDAIPGMDVNQIGKNGLGSVYHSPEKAFLTGKAIQEFTDKGGVGVFLRPATEMKCAGAPLKVTLITEDWLTRKGTRSKSQVRYFAPQKALFSVPIVSEKVRMIFRTRNIEANYEHTLQSIDLGKRIAVFKTPDGPEEISYDFIHVIPPMKAPDAVRNSPLPWQSGPWGQEGWVEVEKTNLRHKRYRNVFAVGDIAGVPKGKTAASAKWQVPVAVDHIVADLAGYVSPETYNGYTSCPLITRLGRAMLIEFDYDNNLIMSFPGIIAPLEELWTSWVMKTMALKPTYISMLRGKA